VDEERQSRRYERLLLSVAYDMMVNPRREVKLMPEYGVDVPLWPRSEETDDLVPPELLQRLIVWQEQFDASFHWESGWADRQTRVDWAAEATALEGLLRDALPPGVTLVVDLWPLSPD
jgi:hypothetical protein